MCRKQPGVSIGKLCERCDGKCVICDSYVRPTTIVRVCDECNYGSYQGRCVICGAPGASEAYYCKECTQQEKDVRLRDGGTRACCRVNEWRTHVAPCSLRACPCLQRDGCPKVINLGTARTDLFYERKKYGFVKRVA